MAQQRLSIADLYGRLSNSAQNTTLTALPFQRAQKASAGACLYDLELNVECGDFTEIAAGKLRLCNLAKN
jgi:hypothetical protein